jgi:tRNA(Ile)-lysidine synthase
MASSRKPPKDKPRGRASVDATVDQLLASLDLKGKRVAIGLSGGVDSVVLLQVLKNLSARHGFVLRAVHVHHGLSANADAWARHCKALCRRLKVPLELHTVKVTKAGRGLEAAAREARHRVFADIDAEVLTLAHQLDDQAETVLHNLLRGAGLRGASGMPVSLRKHGKLLLRPMLAIPREAIVAYARAHALKWIEDESNQDESLTRNFLRRTIGPQLAMRFPRWRENLARAARHFSGSELDANRLLREFLRSKGLRSPSEAKLLEMLRQLSSGSAKASIEHDGARLRAYRDRVFIAPAEPAVRFTPLQWKGERKLEIPALGGELHFRRVRGEGFALRDKTPLMVRLRAGGERLQPDPRRPRRTLKNLFQEAGVPPWQRERLPLLFCGEDLIWAPGLGIEARFRAAGQSAGWLPEWRPAAA